MSSRVTLSGLFKVYNKFVERKPLVGIALTSAGGMAIGNTICQVMMYHKEKKFDLFKVAQYSMYGLLVSGPFLRYWWYFLDLRLFKNPNLALRPVRMMLVDQATTPWILNAAFLYYLSVTEGKSHQEAVKSVENKTIPIVLASYKIWPLATLLNFYVMPLQSRVLFSNVVAVLWTAYMTYLISKKDDNEQDRQNKAN